MEETKKKFPSLPPNYVSLQQLQEQRLREQQQKQIEKEEEEEEERKVEEQRLKEEQQKKEEEEKKRRLVSQKAPRIKTSYEQTSNRNGRNLSQKSWLIKEKNETAAVVVNPEEFERKRQKSWLIKEKNEVVGVLNPDQKVDEVIPKMQKKKRIRSKKNGASEIQKGEAEINVGPDPDQNHKEGPDPDQNHKEIETKKKKKRYRGKKPIAEEETLTEDLTPLEIIPPANTPNENNDTRTGSRRRDNKPTLESVPLNQTMEIVDKIGDLRIRDDEKKSTIEKTKNRKFINRRKLMNGNLMWIRKDVKNDEFAVGSGYIAGNF